MSQLKSLTAELQVALLFVILFGALALVTAIAFATSLREPGADIDAQDRHDRFKRDLRAVWISAIVFWLAWVSGPLGATLLFGVEPRDPAMVAAAAAVLAAVGSLAGWGPARRASRIDPADVLRES